MFYVAYSGLDVNNMDGSNNIWAEIIRATALIYGFFTIYFSISIMITFKKRNPPKLVMQHVVRISLTYVGLVMFAMIDIILLFGEPLTFRSPVLLVLLTTAMFAQVPLAQHERQMLSKEKREQK